MPADDGKAERVKAFAARRDAMTQKYEELHTFVDDLSQRQWTEAKNHIMLNGPLIRAKKVADTVGEAMDLVRQCQVMLDMLPTEAFMLQGDDLDDVELVLTKATNKANNAETEIIDEEERRAAEEAKFTKRLQQEKVENAKRAEDERRAQLLKVMEEEERIKEEERKRAAKAKADAKAKLLLQAKLNEQKQELEARFAKLQRAKEQQQMEEQSVIDIFTQSIFQSTAVEERRNDVLENRNKAKVDEKNARLSKASSFRKHLHSSMRSKVLLQRVRERPKPVTKENMVQDTDHDEKMRQELFRNMQTQLREKYRNLTHDRSTAEEIRERLTQEVQEDDDDDEFEKNDRATAQKLVHEYEGGPFRAAREGNVAMIRAYFLVSGPAKMLATRDKSEEGGGRSLLHTAAWWGSEPVVRYLAQIGADLNAIDTSYNGFTPLMEACRAGHRRVCECLIKHQARLDCQDAQGNTVFHWCARRGWGSLPISLIQHAERHFPGSTKGVMRIRNNKGKYPMDVCNNNKTRAILRQTFAHLTFVPTTVKSDESSASGRSKADKLRHTVKTAKRHDGPALNNRSAQAQYHRYGKLRANGL
eukprot:INCI5311.3.p1 GENE.INCI5311.3~~INCI5311.3.p1  ORF type:complete len:608 (-),score=135.26 INCI5311.3:62-1825(-)